MSNGIAYHGGWLYCTDSVLALVWRVHSDGQSPAEGWTANPLLQYPPTLITGSAPSSCTPSILY